MIAKHLLLPLGPEAAFRLFSERIDEWWPPERRHIQGRPSVIALAEHRFSECAASGEEVELGKVRAWEPPHRILLDWYPGTDAEHPTEVEIRFVPDHGQTRVMISHRAGPKSVALFPSRAPRYGVSWDLVLAALRKAADGT